MSTSPGSCLNVQYGCGRSCPDDWVNFDASPSVWLERFPVIGRWLRVNDERFPERVRYGDIVAGPLVDDGAAKAVYASHVLEHLSRTDCEKAIENTFRMLRPGGIFRLVVPDLRVRVDRYVERANRGDPAAVDDFFASTLLGVAAAPRSVVGKIRRTFGLSSHLWMWDEAAMIKLLETQGFVDVRRCGLGDSEDSAFAAVEDPDRFVDRYYGFPELAIEAKRPLDRSGPHT